MSVFFHVLYHIKLVLVCYNKKKIQYFKNSDGDICKNIVAVFLFCFVFCISDLSFLFFLLVEVF